MQTTMSIPGSSGPDVAANSRETFDVWSIMPANLAVDTLTKTTTLILRSGLLAASRRIGHKRRRSGPSFETPRKRAAPQDED
jgi:hypothetical protein